MAAIFIMLDRPFYFAGDTVNGNVLINLYENVSAHELVIKFKGWECVRWLEFRYLAPEEEANVLMHQFHPHQSRIKMDSSDSEDDAVAARDEGDSYYIRQNGRVKQVFKHAGGKIIAKFQNVLFNFAGNYVPAGQYSFPFSFKTGENYPASFIDKSADGTAKGRIKYEMQAFLRSSQSRLRIMTHKAQVIVRETQMVTADEKTMVAHVKSCCCFDKGVCRIQCYFEKNGYSPGEKATIFCRVDTRQSKAAVKYITVRFLNDITYTSRHNHVKNQSHLLFERRFEGVNIGTEVERKQEVVIAKDDMNSFDIKPTARGDRLRSIYTMHVEAVLDAACTCCSQLPKISQQIMIYPNIPVFANFAAPSNWNPVQKPMFNVQMQMNTVNPNLQAMQNPYY